jgi:autotransporter translocation and assembly factor TamB
MVRRWIFIILGATGLLLLSLAVGAGYWLLARPEGSRWLLHRLAEHSGMARFARVEGTLVEGLLLHDLEVTWPDGELTVGGCSLPGSRPSCGVAGWGCRP